MWNLHFFHHKITQKSPIFQKRQNFKEFLKKQSFENHPFQIHSNEMFLAFTLSRKSLYSTENPTTVLIENPTTIQPENFTLLLIENLTIVLIENFTSKIPTTIQQRTQLRIPLL